MKPADIKAGAAYGRKSLVQELRLGHRVVERLGQSEDGRQTVTYHNEGGERDGEQNTVFLSNFARWAEIEVRPRARTESRRRGLVQVGRNRWE